MSVYDSSLFNVRLCLCGCSEQPVGWPRHDDARCNRPPRHRQRSRREVPSIHRRYHCAPCAAPGRTNTRLCRSLCKTTAARFVLELIDESTYYRDMPSAAPEQNTRLTVVRTQTGGSTTKVWAAADGPKWSSYNSSIFSIHFPSVLYPIYPAEIVPIVPFHQKAQTCVFWGFQLEQRRKCV